ncbi:hypothetical protein BC939DRAFT_468911 [Gamsiella multidivaricata]|uniref:uncharacterized protein n=1 Tax=Gamsiella multidivaricata TaxID=101098 RepID=UPI0022207E62|nr:uncharacterized protein BC939DRAFT_468911 [Gamsiella multidivaricata]KAG0367306.1 hypothetical protein BGZ54_004096 [Gamsiella multidivaricata]KAI7816482.1 hypothetical protein BC939DRAFT_468911 [Gamsiella multidivaricata]
MSRNRIFKEAAILVRSASRTALAQARPASTVRLLSLTAATRTTPVVHGPRHRFAQHSIAQRAYSTSLDQSLSPLARSVIATTRAVRNILIFSTSTLTLGYFVWAGSHAYLEQYKCPSPEGVSAQVRNCLHGAWVREEISPDPDVAAIYLQKALEFARKDLEEFYRKKNHSLEYSSLEIEKDKALVEIQNRLARFYGRIGRDEQAATIWTRLWKLTEKEVPPSSDSAKAGSSSSSSGLGLRSLFGGASIGRPLITKQDGVPFAKSAANCWMRMGEYDLAEEALSWTLSTITTAANADATGSTSDSIEEVGLLSTLGALYVRQRKSDYALSLFVKALQLVQHHRAVSEQSNTEKDMWYCREAILTNSIGETLYGATTAARSKLPMETAEQKKPSSWKFWSSSSSSTTGGSGSAAAFKTAEQTKKEEEALGWMQKAVAMAKEKSGQHRDCDECAALGLNNLGLINEMEGKTDVALQQFREAVLHATMANDFVGLEDYNKNTARLTDRIASTSEEQATVPASLSTTSSPTTASA